MRDLFHQTHPAQAQPVFGMAAQVLAGADSWGPGRLCMTGGHLEQTFVSDGGGIRLTVDPGDPKAGGAGQLQRALDWIEKLGLPAGQIHDLWLRRVVQGQAEIASDLRFGAWLGLRATPKADGICARIYAEAPDGLQSHVADQIGRLPTGVGLPGPMTVVGMGTDGSVELYFAARDLLPSAIGAILQPAGLDSRTREVLDLLADLTLSQQLARLPVRDIGYSYAISSAKGIDAVTIYATALGLFGRDQVAATRLAQAASLLGGDLTTLQRRLAAAPNLPPGVLHCGMVGITLRANQQRPILSCGAAISALDFI